METAVKEADANSPYYPLTEEEVHHFRNDPAAWIEHFGWFEDEATLEKNQIKLNILQRRAIAVYKRRIQAGKPCKIVVLKPRGRGGSTLAAGLLYHHIMNFKINSGLIGTTYTASDNIFKMLVILAEWDEFTGWKKTFERRVHRFRKWWHGGSAMEYTADNPESARSARLQAYHATEVARWQNGGALDAGATLRSMRGALPKSGIHFVIEESTPNGSVGEFFDTFMGGRWDENDKWWLVWQADTPQNIDPIAGEDQYVRIFAAWFEFDDAWQKLDADSLHLLQSTLTEEERALLAKYGNSTGPQKCLRLGWVEKVHTAWEQLAWRRKMIATVCKKSPKRFDEEYPSDPKSCFLASGAPVFNGDGLLYLESMCLRSYDEGDLTYNGERANFTPDPNGLFKIWERPTVDRRYLLVIDPAQEESQKNGEDPDRHSVIVIRDGYRTDDGHEQLPAVVARIKEPCHLNFEPLGIAIEALCHFYGRCCCLPEMNNTGSGIIEQLRKRHLPIFHRTRIDPITSKVTEHEGWDTNDDTRRQLVEAMKTRMLKKDFEAYCPNIAAEYKTFVRHRSGKCAAAEGSHDDDVLSVMIGMYNLSAATVYNIPVLARQNLSSYQGEQKPGQNLTVPSI